jgi:hypothetical protein
MRKTRQFIGREIRFFDNQRQQGLSLAQKKLHLKNAQNLEQKKNRGIAQSHVAPSRKL